jgi:hypothetical protein
MAGVGTKPSKVTTLKVAKVLDKVGVSAKTQQRVALASTPPPYKPAFLGRSLRSDGDSSTDLNNQIIAATGLAIGAGALYLAFSK